MPLNIIGSGKSQQTVTEAGGGRPERSSQTEECALSMAFAIRSRLWAGLGAGALAVAAPVAVTASTATAHAASAAAANTPEKVATGVLASALPGASAFGDTSLSTPEQVSFIL